MLIKGMIFLFLSLKLQCIQHLFLWVKPILEQYKNRYRAKSLLFYRFWRDIKYYITPKAIFFISFGVV